MPDVALMIQSGFTPQKEWIERHFRVELEDKKEDPGAPKAEDTTFSPEEDQDLFGSIFGTDAENVSPTEEQPEPEPFGDEMVTEDEAVAMDEK
jgi:hypothetical protein